MPYQKIYLRPDLDQLAKTKPGHMWVNIDHLKSTSQSLASYQNMAEEMRKLLPGIKLTDAEISCSKVVKSHTHYGFSCVTWNGMIPVQNNFAELGWFVTDKPRQYQLA